MSEEEFRKRVMPLQRLMYGMALRMGMSPEDAADAVQETQVRLWRRRDGIPDPPGELKLYCLAAFRNECLTQMRRRRPSVALEEAAELREAPVEDAEFRDTRARIEMLIDRLPRGQREVIRLSGFGGFDSSEIAEATGQTDNNVRQLLSRGRRRLREMIVENELI